MGAELLHVIDDVAIIRCDVERKCDVGAPTCELDRVLVDGLSTPRTDAENVGQIVLLE